MFDTNIFNRILDDQLPLEKITANAEVYATHIQRDEIQNTADKNRREALLKVFHELTSKSVPTASTVADISRADESKVGGSRVIPTESAVWDVSRWDEAKWSNGYDLYTPIRTDLDIINCDKKNNPHDALIAETAIDNNFVLVTEDADLARVASRYGAKCATLTEFLSGL